MCKTVFIGLIAGPCPVGLGPGHFLTFFLMCYGLPSDYYRLS